MIAAVAATILLPTVDIPSAHLGGIPRDGLLTKSEETKHVRLWKEVEANGLEMTLGKHSSTDPKAGIPISALVKDRIRNNLDDVFAEPIDACNAEGTTTIGTFPAGSR